MKRLLLIAAIAALGFAKDVLPQNFGQCVGISYFTPQNAPIPLKDNYLDIKKYDCNNDIIYIGIEDQIPGILKLNVNNNTKDFLLEHFKINGYQAAVYIDKGLKKGVIAVKLNNKYALKLLFNGTDYKKSLIYLQNLNFKEIENKCS